MTRRLVLPEGFLVEGELALPEELAHYVRRVLRLRPDEELDLSDGAGQQARGMILAEGRVRIEKVETAEEPPGPHLTLIQGIAKGDKMDSVIRQATELGVRKIQPVICERSVALQQNRVARWKTIAEDALRVSGRFYRPRIEPVIPLTDLWDRPRAQTAFCLALNAETGLPSNVKDAEILIGPEGGLTTDEIAQAQKSGFTSVHLGEHTLRTETAGPAVLSILMYGSGGFG